MDLIWQANFTKQEKQMKRHRDNLSPYRNLNSHNPFWVHCAHSSLSSQVPQTLWAHRWLCFSSTCAVLVLPALSCGHTGVTTVPSPVPSTALQHAWDSSQLHSDSAGGQHIKQELPKLGNDFSQLSGLKHSRLADSDTWSRNRARWRRSRSDNQYYS